MAATATPTPWYKKRHVLGLATIVLISGAIVAGVLGSRASKARSSAPAIQSQGETESTGIKSVLDALFDKTDKAATDATPAVEQDVAGSSVLPATGAASSSSSGSSSTSSGSTTSGGISGTFNQVLKPDDVAAVDNSIGSIQKTATDAVVQQQSEAAKTMAALIVASGASWCYPENGDQLHVAVDEGKCTVIALNRREYKLHKQIVINRPIVIVGNPILLPYIDGFTNERIFHLVAGGYLDIRFVRLQQGVGRMLTWPVGRPIHLRHGTVARVDLGAHLTLTGCMLETRAQTVQSFLTEIEENFTQQRLTIGGYIAVMGGSVDLIGCITWRFRPYGNPNFMEINVGRDVVMMAGTINIVGTFYGNLQLFHNKNSAGGIWAVMGGNLIVTGMALATITGANAQWGTGLQTYVGGGNAIFTGGVRFSASIVLARGGFGLFSVSAGNMVFTGYEQASARVASGDFGTALFSVGAGTLTQVGSGLFSAHVARTNHIAGGYFFNGAGVMNLIGNARTNQGVTTTQEGIGLFICTVAGVQSVVIVSSYTVAAARCQIGAGTDTFIAAGFLSFIRVFRYRNILYGLFIGQGNQVWVASGAGVFIRCRQAARIHQDWRTTRNVYTVAGTQVGRAGANTNIYLSKEGRVNLGDLGFPQKKQRKLTHHFDQYRSLQQRDLTAPDEDGLIPRSFLLVVDNKFYEAPLEIPSQEEIEAAKLEIESLPNGAQSLAFLRAAQKKTPFSDENKLQIYTNNTDCLACDVPNGQLVGETPCAASNRCAGKSLQEILSLDETPKGLKDFAEDLPKKAAEVASGLSEVDPSVLGQAADIASGFGSEQYNARKLQQADDAEKKLPDVWVAEGSLTVYCQPDQQAAATAPVSCGVDYRTVRVALSYTLGDLTGAAEDFSVSAWDTKIKPQFFTYLADELKDLEVALEAPPSQVCPQGAAATTYGFTVTVTDETQRAAVQARLDALSQDPTVLKENIEYLDESATTYCDLVFTRKDTTVVPGVPRALDPATVLAGAIGPAVVVTGPDAFGNIKKAVPGETYELSIANWPVGSTVEVSLIDAKTGQAVANQVATTIKPTLLKKPTTVEWQVPADLPLDGYYYLQASLANAKGVNALTLPFHIGTA